MQDSAFRLLNSLTQEGWVFIFIYQSHRAPHRASPPLPQEDDDCVTSFPPNDIDFIKLLKPNYENLLHQQHFIRAHKGPKKCKTVYFTWMSRKRDGCTPEVQAKETLEPSELGAEPHVHPRRKVHTSFLFSLGKEAQIPILCSSPDIPAVQIPQDFSASSVHRGPQHFQNYLKWWSLIGSKMKG